MNDTKNILLAWVSSVSSVLTALEAGTWTTLLSAVVLPITFFIVGKAIDVALQIYFSGKGKRNADETDKTDQHG